MLRPRERFGLLAITLLAVLFTANVVQTWNGLRHELIFKLGSL
jgi:hypothetical protein